MPRHASKLLGHIMWHTQHFQKQSSVRITGAERFVNQWRVSAQQALRIGLDTINQWIIAHQHEKPQQIAGPLPKDVIVARSDATVAHLKVVINDTKI